VALRQRARIRAGSSKVVQTRIGPRIVEASVTIDTTKRVLLVRR
jgi:hypothetical protein